VKKQKVKNVVGVGSSINNPLTCSDDSDWWLGFSIILQIGFLYLW
jgi:hypothetical protein